MSLKINLNTADIDTIAATMPQVNTERANAIVQYRENHGPFKNFDQLRHVVGFSEKLVEALPDFFTLEDEISDKGIEETNNPIASTGDKTQK